jgi:formylmethanofuran dehydrogenase subunit A
MFELPRYVIKSGQILVEEGDIRIEHYGKLLHVAPSYDPGAETDISQWFEDCYSIRFRNYAVGSDYSHQAEQVPCGS